MDSMNCGYMDVMSRTGLCHASTTAPVGAAAATDACGTNPDLGDGFYDAPTQYGAIGITLALGKKFRSSVGYSMCAVNGTKEIFNQR